MDQNAVLQTPVISLITWGVLRLAKHYKVPTRFFPVIANVVSLILAVGVSFQTGATWETVIAQAIGGGALAVWGDNVKERSVLGKQYQQISGE